MSSEEQYLDDLLKSVTADDSKERSMEEVMREMNQGGEMISEPTPDIPEEVIAENTEDITSEDVSEITPDALADMLDLLDTPENFAEEPVVEEPVIEEPVIEEPVIEEPVVEETVVEAPVIEEPVIEEPVIEEPVIEEPVTEEPSMEELMADLGALTETFSEENEEVIPEVPEEVIPEPAEEVVEDEIIPESTEEEIADEETVENEEPESFVNEEFLSENGISVSDDDVTFEDEPQEEENAPETIDDLIKAVSEMDESAPAQEPEEDLSEDFDLEAMFAELGGNSSGYEEDEEPASGSSDEPAAEQNEDKVSPADMIDNIGDSDEDLLALLEGIDENMTEEEKSADSSGPAVGEDFSESANDEINELLGSDEKASEDGKKKKFSLFGKKKDKKKNKKNKGKEEGEDNEDIQMDSDFDPIEVPEDDTKEVSDILDTVEMQESPETEAETEEVDFLKAVSKKGKVKKPGFFSKLLAILTEEVDEEEEKEEVEEKSNEDILAEIDAENADAVIKEKKGKKGKKSKKKDKKKASAEGEEGEESEEGQEGKKGKKKKTKKEKKPKEPKEKKEKVREKAVLSKKARLCLIAFCMTLVATCVILSTVLPDHSDKVRGRAAYYRGDYEACYDLLHNKKLNESDSYLYQRARNVVMIKHRWDSYNNRVKLGQDEEALDSLIEGVIIYLESYENAGNDIKDELDHYYQIILETLKTKYGLSAEDAIKIYDLEKEDYSRIIRHIVRNEAWYMPGEEPPAEPEAKEEPENKVNEEDADLGGSNFEEPVDMLPEEEDINRL